MSHEEAENFFLKDKSYCNIDLPEYFSFARLLGKISKAVDKVQDISTFYNEGNLRNCEKVNHILFANKDGKLSWRPLQIIHPFLYVLLVKEITKEDNWTNLLKRFAEFQKNDKIKCFSIPVEAKSRQSDKAEQILQWWENIEQESINQSLDYKFSYDTDIADCYGSIYTHSIAWAIETREIAKEQRDRNLLGNKIDTHIRNMQYGQTNGIPQGSVLMDFIAEIILGYIDELLTVEITKKRIKNYNIFRYRDDYKIFVNTPNDGEVILRLLSELIVPFGLKLNSSKTRENKNIISSSVKPDKLSWFQLNQGDLTLQKQFLLIHQHSIIYPNSGSIVRGLTELNKKISDKEKSPQIISITVDIMFHNPKAIPVCCSIISKILRNTEKKMKSSISNKIYRRLMETPNSEFAQIWLQRMLKNSVNKFDFKEALCSIVKGENIEIWDNSWFNGNNRIKKLILPTSIFDKTIFKKMDDMIKDDEVDIFIHSL
ncbi:RNA-directed DNA polymerase [Hoylesella nanceiensis]|uniref:RNA-directed DNA polymerase n=1 Tax=Hoylesella nanceiensis TaxID=425941 RepID=UPI0028E93BDB|nr:RNA-directed DNA polymerase [Hoylesella nanceiensis]